MTKDEKIKELEAILRDTLWMARRYANNRSTYAVRMFNDAIHKLDDLSLSHLMSIDQIDNSRWADDGDFGIYQPDTRNYKKNNHD